MIGFDERTGGVEVVAALLDTVEPAKLHQQAAFFDEVSRWTDEVADRFRRVLAHIDETWARYGLDAPASTGTRSAATFEELLAMRPSGAGTVLHRAADSLAQARMSARELRAVQASGVGPTESLDEQARALLHRVSADFVDAGTQLLATSADVRQVVSPALASRISMDLAAAPIRADDTVTIIDANARLEPTGAALPRASLGLGTVPSVQADTSNPAAGGQPMMPFMPFGMGMTSSAGGGRERSVRGQGTADPVSWSDPDSGWDVVGRQPPDELVPEPRSALAAERAAQDAIESLMNERWESLLGRGSRT